MLDESPPPDVTLVLTRSAKNGQLYASKIHEADPALFPAGVPVSLVAVALGSHTPVPAGSITITPSVATLDLTLGQGGLPFSFSVVDDLGRKVTNALFQLSVSDGTKVGLSTASVTTDTNGVGIASASPLATTAGVTITIRDAANTTSAQITATVAGAPVGQTALEDLRDAIASVGGTLTLPFDRKYNLTGDPATAWADGILDTTTLTASGSPDVDAGGRIVLDGANDYFRGTIAAPTGSSLISYIGDLSAQTSFKVYWDIATADQSQTRQQLAVIAGDNIEFSVWGSGNNLSVSKSGLTGAHVVHARRVVSGGIVTEMGLRIGSRTETTKSVSSSPTGDGSQLTVGANRSATPSFYVQTTLDAVLIVDTNGLSAGQVAQIVTLINDYATAEHAATIATDGGPAPAFNSLSIPNASVTLQEGGSAFSETVTALDQFGNPINGVTISATSTTTAAATVSPASVASAGSGTAGFTYTPVAAGSTTIEYRVAGNLVGSVAVSVQPTGGGGGETVASLQLSSSSGTIEEGQATSVLVLPRKADGSAISDISTHTVSASSSNPGVADVTIVLGQDSYSLLISSTGGPGAATISTTVDGVQATFILGVSAAGGIGTFFENTNVEFPRLLPDMPDRTTWAPDVTLTLAAQADLNSALANAALQTGQEIDVVVPDASTWTGTWTLPTRPGGAGWVRVRAANTTSWLPAVGTRAKPSIMANAPVLRVNATQASSKVFDWANGAHRYWFQGLTVTCANTTAGFVLNALLASAAKQSSQTPVGFCLDRCVVTGNATMPLSRPFMANLNHLSILDTSLLEGHVKGFDAQALQAHACDGVWYIDNCHLEGSGENILLGGAQDTLEPSRQMADITIKRTWFSKPLSWKGTWTIKNIVELKTGVRVWYDRCVMEGCWTDGQIGYGINDKVSQPDGRRTRDVIRTWNLVFNVGLGIGFGANPNGVSPENVNRYVVADSVIAGVDPPNTYDGGGHLIQHSGTPIDYLTIRRTHMLYHNNHTGSGNLNVVTATGPASIGVNVEDSIFMRGAFGWKGTGVGEGDASINQNFDAATRVIRNNAIEVSSSAAYASGFPTANGNLHFIGTGSIKNEFVDFAGGTLDGIVPKSTSALATGSTVGGAVGCNIAQLKANLAGVRDGGVNGILW